MKAQAASAVALLLAACAPSVSGGSRLLTGGTAVGDFTVPMQSVADRRYAGVVRQRYDFSCGSAALATLLRHHYDFAVDEESAFRGMWVRGDQAQIRRLGFSLLDMKKWLASRGLRGDGYKVSLDLVEKTGIPGIALIAIRNYRHFVVVKGVSRDEVLLGDPSSGISVVPRRQFETSWNGIYFILDQDQQVGRQRFNRPAQWMAFQRAPLGGHFAGPVSQQELSLTAPFYGDIS